MKLFAAAILAVLCLALAAWILGQKDDQGNASPGNTTGAIAAANSAADLLSSSSPRMCDTGNGPFGPESYISHEVFGLTGSPYFTRFRPFRQSAADGTYFEGPFGIKLGSSPDYVSRYLAAVEEGAESRWNNLDVVWDHTIGLVSFHWSENIDKRGNETGASFGLNVFIDDPFIDDPEISSTSCAAKIQSADFATADDVTGSPSQINIHTYVAPASIDCSMVVYSVGDDVLVGSIPESCLELQEVDVFSNAGGTVTIGGHFTAVSRSRLR